MALVFNCNGDVDAVVFISGLQVSHSFHKYLVKHEVTWMRDVLSQAPMYMQIENTTWGELLF